jgi:4-hydroxy-4-methyl-2-oxoglutarate aldolase
MADPVMTLVELGVPTLYEAAGRRGLMQGLRLVAGAPFAGRAQTAQIPAGDNLGIHAGLREPRAGDVFCVASAGQGMYGVIGELLVEQFRTAGWIAIVLDDAARDIELLNPPPSIAARGVCSRGTVKLRPGRSGVDVSMAGVLVRPGDWIIGDHDGVMVLPDERRAEVVSAAQARFEKETRIAGLVRSGHGVLDAGRILAAAAEQ